VFLQDNGRETEKTGEQEAVGQRERSRSRAACYFKHDDDSDAQVTRRERGGKKKRGCRRRIRLAWGRSGCHFRT